MVCNSQLSTSKKFELRFRPCTRHVNRVVRLNQIFTVHHPFDTEKERRKKKEKKTKKASSFASRPKKFSSSYDELYDNLASQTCSFEKFSYIPRVFEFHLVCFEKVSPLSFLLDQPRLHYFTSIQESLLSLISYYLAVVHSTWHLDQIKSKAFRHKP